MGDNIRRRMQDITLGVNDAPIALPKSVCVQAAQANRYSIIGALVNPRKQNMRALIGQLPRLWGMEDTVVGRMVDARKFQFVFQSEESLNVVLRRGPWSFSEWMLVTQKWIPNMPDSMMKIIPFWTQIHGIPIQYLTLEMINTIARSLGQVSGVDFDESSTRVDYVRVRLDWNIDQPLRFKREFQFGHNESVVLSFYYERLRSFCVICGMLTHDKKDCPLRFDVGDDDGDFPDQDDNDNPDANNNGPGNDEKIVETEGGNRNDEGLNHDSKVEVVAEKQKLDPTMVASTSRLSEPITEKSLSLILDKDLTAETWRYLQAKMAKGKFNDEDFLNLITEYSKIEENSGSAKRPREEEEIKPLVLSTSAVHVQIPGVTVTNDDHKSVNYTELVQGLELLKNQTEEERYMMIQRYKGTFTESDYIDGFEDYAKVGDEAKQLKRRRIEVEKWLSNTPLHGKEDRLDLFPIREMSPVSSMGSFEVVQCKDRGAGGPVPPPVP